MLEHITALQPKSILDIGAGEGTYARLLRPHLPDADYTAIEIYAPYVDRYGLHQLYDRVIVNDVRTMNNLPLADVVILGDVLEHLRFDEARWLWQQARDVANLGVFLSLPIVEYPQAECEGNPHEAHLETWTHDRVMADLAGITDHATYAEIGVYHGAPTK